MRDMSLYVLLTDGGDRVGQVWDIVPPCPAKRPRDGVGQVGDAIPACPAKATSPGGFGVSSLPCCIVTYRHLAPIDRCSEPNQPVFKPTRKGPYTASASMPPSGLQDVADVLSDVLKAAAGTPWSSRSP
jgi:hypothetical protein